VAWLIRQRLTGWLSALGWPELAVEDVVFAVSEAVSNCAEHAYPPDTPDPVIEVSAVIEPAPGDGKRPGVEDQQPGQRVRIRVRDHGTWRPVGPGPSHRGRGLHMMIALMDDVVIHHSDTGRAGTEIVMISPTVVPAPPSG
jgi:anti-sigma regulatory factor (Ser/Thr protein kinase)